MFARTRHIKLSPIKAIELAAARIPGVISLAQGIPSFDTPTVIQEEVKKALDRGLASRYSLSPGIIPLRELIEEKLATHGMFYDWEEEIIITVGAIEAITATFLTILDPGDEVIIPSPTYTSYQEAIKIAGGKPVFADLIEEKSWAFSLANFQDKLTSRTKAILFCNPNNPTGTIYTKEQLLQLAQLAKEHNLLILSDEVYQDFCYDDQELFSLAQVSELRERVVRIFSFSKSYAMTGWRIGFLHTDAKVAREILKIHDSLVTCAPVISQYAALVALEQGDEEIANHKVEYRKRRELICRRLDKMADIFTYQVPDSAYYVFPKYRPEIKSADLAIDILQKAKVALVPGVAFGPTGEYHLRFSFGRAEADINEAFDRLEEYFK